MLTLHHLEQSRSFRILWALEELGLEYQIKLYKRLPTFSGPPELKEVHPLGKAPILTDDDQCIAESAVILEYLQEHFDESGQLLDALCRRVTDATADHATGNGKCTKVCTMAD